MQIRQTLSILLISQQILSNDAFTTHVPQRQQRSALFSNGKDNHRARVEKNLEEMMGRDWREFRATLVAQEAAEERANKHDQQVSKHTQHVTDAKKPEKFGNLFAAIFQNKENNDASIFDGKGIGGATSESMIPASCEDPFVSKAELPVLLQPKVHVDKHRWAHAMPHIEPGCVLIANEKLGGVFHQTIVLIIDHNDITGSTGIVINR
jgi:putative transcriptional regulator